MNTGNIAEHYHLIAYDVTTGHEVLNWPTVIATRIFARGDVIEDGNIKWEVIGVRSITTGDIRHLDVKKRE